MDDPIFLYLKKEVFDDVFISLQQLTSPLLMVVCFYFTSSKDR